MNHTKGPWQVVYPLNDLSITEIRTLRDEQTGHVATIGVSFVDSETQANARLIAAAPDLLAALKRTLARLESHTASIETCDLPSGTELALDQARAAIAKATEGKE